LPGMANYIPDISDRRRYQRSEGNDQYIVAEYK
jgi:hypothetical protein